MLTVTDVRELALHRGAPAVTSVYLDVDGRSRPVADDYRAAFERLADGLRRQARAAGEPRLGRAVESDIDRMRAWLRLELDRATTRGVALFSSSEQSFFEAIEVPRPVHDAAGIGPTPRVAQLLAALDEHEPFLVVLVDGRRARVLRVELGEAAELPGIMDLEERAVDTSVELGSFQRHRQDQSRAHYRRCADLVERVVTERPSERLVLAGPGPAVAALEARLRRQTRNRIVGRAGLGAWAEEGEILAAVSDIERAAERRHEADLVEELRQRAAAADRGVVGLEATVAALAEERVGTLLVSEGFSAPGARCPACGWTGVGVRQCPACRATTAEIDDVVELAITRAVAQGATIEFCRGTELERFGRIGALTRY